ncbi:tetratricopeptide repeat protein [Actinoplanes sp. NEAU-A12]|uniref:Tetratricopeptide repeat protein n=1 Tax=Actinoplanes sandaracinus TaxID=3045177 RepID=A0ABT6X1X8_9ACTN|nr:tetratricopeptide repeat protein [Actinoplanes sandaracinus]MDI6105937.1 tetratricopeptide repeat protein [Actinoplanes sandaracinus]
MSRSGSLALARVMAHCGGSPAEAAAYAAGAIADDPADPEPYKLLADLGGASASEIAAAVAAPTELWQFVAASYLRFLNGEMDQAAGFLGLVIGYRPHTAWAFAPWFSDERFVSALTAAGLADASLNITDYGTDLDNDQVRENLRPWFRAIEVVCARKSAAADMARMAILLRFCGCTDESLALCERADSVERVMLTEVVRAGTWRRLGNRQETAAAFRRALQLEPSNWSLYLDLADLAAEDGDFPAAADLVSQGLAHEPHDVTLRAAGAAYRVRATGSIADLDLLLELAVKLPHGGYRNALIEHALGKQDLPSHRIAAARRLQMDD